MAFIDFTEPQAGPRIAAPAIAPTAIAAETFAPQEWQIIMLARGDGLGSLRAPNVLDRLRERIFGAQTNLRLASERLEALRRLAVESWHHSYAVSLSALADFRVAGFSTAQLELLLATISAGRNARTRRDFAWAHNG